MARITVEDCKKVIPNHFELVVLASRRGRDISSGSPILVEKSNDKNAVIALREIAASKINVDILRENLLQDFCKTRHNEDDLNDNKQESYLELENQENNQFSQNFEDELAEGMSSIELESEFNEEEMSFEDEEIENEN
ncbi:MAG: DNA-directed RNA polymerase subunit omega [Rickettsiales bacterium]